MSEFDLSPAAQHWVNVVLVWIGFGALSGLLARAVLPLRQPVGPLPTMVVGIVGSALGLLALSLLWSDRPMNPISPAGFLAATAGALVVLIIYRLCVTSRPKKEEGDGGDL